MGKANAFTAPITVVNYDEQALNNTEARTLVDAVAKKDASVWQFGGESNTLTGLYFRGYQLDSRQFSVNGLAGMYGTQGTASVQVGSAQLIKGASTAVNGMDPEGAVSGSVNIETKKAADEGNRKIGLGWFSNNRAQGTFDLGQRFGENKAFGVRANGKLRHGDTPRHGYSEDNKEFAVNADYRGETLRVAFDSIYAKRKTNGGRARMQDIQNAGGRLFGAPDGKTNLLPSWNWQNTAGQTNMLTFEWDAFDNAQITGGIGYNKARYYGTLISPTVCLNATSTCTDMQNTNASGKVTARNYDYNTGTARLTDQYFRTLSMNLSARGEFETGPVTHNWSTAFDRVIRQRKTIRGTAAGAGKVEVKANENIANQLASFKADYPNSWENSANLDANIKVNSLALSDTLGFVDNKYRLTLGGRFQAVEYTNKKKSQSGDAKRFSPMLMAAWVPQPDLVVYGNYMEDLEPADIKDDGTGDTTMAKPRVSRQFEVGVRKNWGDFVTTLNAFQIKRPGYWRGNTKTGTDFAAYKTQGGAKGDEQGMERNRGIEFNTYANLLNNTLHPTLGLMYLQSTVKDYPNSRDMLVNGVQVANPRVIAKAGVEWDTPFAKGLTLNGNVSYFGKSYQDTKKQYAFPSYTLVDVGARYKTKLGKNTLTVSSSVENLFNKNYWQVQRGQYDRSFAVVGMPRTYWLKAELDF
ncbi:TPA: TonB-dependent siderophore receptor [Neisseria meningitidis]|uniref:TonB-dependent receptor n=1 Tax=Neisseria meningitidis TaxID=487 RepID=UPI00067FB6F1|nr:TonB-dependent receptor [Neisseria meningitidis]MCL4981545.1 TonB-dependent siderophore receptor [Neisseria meningitidis]MCL5003270.1 TonB-dependent siderophore receptor [Neisseria meningitidis]MCL5704170.1 TonB-dependent siderophore receptor [Neisseria meningitidis]MCL5718232.1 TonB-dependent siderophore receptor [Neisseria meningitidis]MCL5827437.1 TonB-dependent siderophore receptor [Neisseria meningitidis]